jgi:hypothetical protein
MIGTLIGIIFVLIILGVIWWAAQQLIGLIPMAEPFPTIIRVILVVVMVIIVLWVCAQLLGMAGIHVGTGFGSIR